MRVKRAWLIVVVVVLLVGALAVAWAQRGGRGEGGMMGGRGGAGMMGGMGGMMGGGMMMNCPMAGMMSRAAMAVAPNGMVYVLAGTALQQYDQNLNLVKEVQIAPNAAAMQQMMQSCPMAGQGMGPRGQMPPPGQAPPPPGTPQ